VRGTTAIEGNDVTLAREIPSLESESRRESVAGAKGRDELRERSPPISARDCSFTD
jgi:hypothetical protein